jgi:hypothetical protein
MMLASESAFAVFRALSKCCQEVEPEGKWQWRCALLNGARLSVSTTLCEGFLGLECDSETAAGSAAVVARAISANAFLRNGAKLVLDAASRCLHLHCDIAVLDESQLLARLEWALGGFHQGVGLLSSLHAEIAPAPEPAEAATCGCLDLQELMCDSSWQFTERGPGKFAVELESDSAPPALVCVDERGISASVELVRCSRGDEVIADALAFYLLTFTGATRLVGATRHCGDQEIFALRAGLPDLPAAEEFAHALAALSFAHRACTHEANVLLNEGAARCYLAARDSTINHQANQ